MNLRKILMVSIISIGLAFGANNASAAIVDYSGGDVNMGNVVVGQSGTITGDSLGALIVNNISGALPNNSMITFTYNFAGNLLGGILASGAEYSYNVGADNFSGSTLSINPMGLQYSFGTTNGTSSAALAMASAQIDFTANTATAIITNDSAGLLDFASFFTGLVIGDNNLSVAYSVSSVPLPAALPLFGLGLTAFAGYSIRKRKKQAV